MQMPRGVERERERESMPVLPVLSTASDSAPLAAVDSGMSSSAAASMTGRLDDDLLSMRASASRWVVTTGYHPASVWLPLEASLI